MSDGNRLSMDPEPKGHDEPLRSIRYVFTIVCEKVSLPDNPVVQRSYLDGVTDGLRKLFPAGRLGITAVMED